MLLFCSQEIRVQLEGQPPKICLLSIIGDGGDSESAELSRICCIQQQSPVQTFQFSESGELLMANTSALARYPKALSE